MFIVGKGWTIFRSMGVACGPFCPINSPYHMKQRILQPVAQGKGPGCGKKYTILISSHFLGLYYFELDFSNRNMETILPKTSHTNLIEEKPGTSWGCLKLLLKQSDAGGGQPHGGECQGKSHCRDHEEKTFAVKNLLIKLLETWKSAAYELRDVN